MTASLRLLASAVLAHVLASLLHFADNAVRFDHYHDDATLLLNPTAVVVAWSLQTAMGVASLLLVRRGSPAGRPILVAYGVLGFAGLLHYLAPPSHGMGLAMHGLIVLEAATGLGVIAAAVGFRPTRPA